MLTAIPVKSKIACSKNAILRNASIDSAQGDTELYLLLIFL